MSVLIKGMEMPKKGEYKPLYIYDTGEVTMEIRGEEVQVATAVPVPPHGRLIDADALMESKNQYYQYAEDEWCVRVRTIEAAPAIIEAEEDE